MSGNYLLDTNIVIALLNGDKTIPSKLDTAETVCISVTVIGELLYGAKRSQQVKRNTEKLKKFISKCLVLSVNEDTAERYSTIKDFLMKKGCPIPENDIWIAAIAQQHGFALITRDEHFYTIPDIVIEQW